MTGEQLQTFLENLLDDAPDVTMEFQLLSQAKNIIERTYKPKILEKNDSSNTRSSGDTYLTMKNLADDFRSMNKFYVGTQQYLPVPFNRRIDYRSTGLKYYIDYRNSQFAVCGAAGSGETISYFYQMKTTDLTEANKSSTIITWPSEFHPLCAYVAARIQQGNVDPDNISIRQSLAQNAEAIILLDAFLAWDLEIKAAEQDNQRQWEGEDVPIDIGLL